LSETPAATDYESDWPVNYFNYFTEIEEHFQRARGTGLFLMSPLDWALIENWKNAGVPLEAVLLGIDEAFARWRRRKQKRRMVNSLAYCTQAVMEAAQRVPLSREGVTKSAEPPFSVSELTSHLSSAALALRKKHQSFFSEIASALDTLAENAEEHIKNLEDLERRLTVLEEKIVAALRTLRTDEELYILREALDRELKPYRGKMTAEQLVVLERRYLDTAILEQAQLPRLSLFYLR
jgi:hypothetical protein